MSNLETNIRDKLGKGVQLAVDLVGRTQGAGGKFISLEYEEQVRDADGFPIDKKRWHTQSKDGYRTLLNLQDDDPIIDRAIREAKNAAGYVNRIAGDGTTGVVLTMGSMYQSCREFTGSPLMLQAGALDVVNKVEEYLRSIVHNPTTFQERIALARTATSSPDYAQILVEIYDKYGENLSLSYRGGKLGYDVSEGYRSPATLGGQSQVDKKLQYATIGEADVIIYNRILSTSSDMAKIISFTNNKPFVVVARDYMGNAANTFEGNSDHNILILKYNPDTGGSEDLLYDLGAYTGAKILESLDALDEKVLGRVASVSSTPQGTIISSDVDCSQYLNDLTQKAGALEGREKEELDKRIRGLQYRLAEISIPVTGQSDLLREADRLDDGWFALVGAGKEGYVVGGGIALLNARKVLKTEGMAGDALWGARGALLGLTACLNNILKGTGYRLNQVGGERGYNQLTGKVENLKTAGILDSVPSIMVAYRTGILAAVNLLSLGGALKLVGKNK